MKYSLAFSGEKTFRQNFWRAPSNILIWSCIAIALAGSIFSALNICTGSACTDAHSYRLFGLSFAVVGIPLFVVLALLRSFLHRFIYSEEFYDTILYGCAGAELWFFWVQKYEIGHWCPVCVVIAFAVFVLALMRMKEKIFSRKELHMKRPQNFWRKCLPIAVFIMGLTFAMAGVRRADAEEGLSAANIWLGKKRSNIEVYYVNDWYCSFCRKAEPVIERMLPAVGKVARYTFIDYPVHKESYDFIPFNLSLLMNEQKRYMKARQALLEVANKTKTPVEATIREALARKGITLEMAEFSAVIKTSFEVSKFLSASGVRMTPSVVILNTKTGEKKLLVGVDQIQKSTVLSTIKDIGMKPETFDSKN